MCVKDLGVGGMICQQMSDVSGRSALTMLTSLFLALFK